MAPVRQRGQIMARREVVDCDRCHEKGVAAPVTIHVHVGWQTCAAGGPSEREMERLDLCHKCAASLLSSAVEAMGDEAAARWYARAKEKRQGSGR